MKATITTFCFVALSFIAQAQYKGGIGSGYSSAKSQITWLNAQQQYRAPYIARFVTFNGRRLLLPTGISVPAKEVTLVINFNGPGTVIWGDGTFTVFAEGQTIVSHSYQQGGNYNIKISPYRKLISLNVYYQ